MQSGNDLVGKMVVSTDEGRNLGTVKDLYLDRDLRTVVGIYLGPERLFSKKTLCIEAKDIVTYGVDAVLVTRSDSIIDATPACESAQWVRRNELHGRILSTAGGTKVGTVDDVILDADMNIVGLALDRVLVEGPIAERQAITREAVISIERESGLLIVNLSMAESGEIPGEEVPEDTAPVDEVPGEVVSVEEVLDEMAPDGGALPDPAVDE